MVLKDKNVYPFFIFTNGQFWIWIPNYLQGLKICLMTKMDGYCYENFNERTEVLVTCVVKF